MYYSGKQYSMYHTYIGIHRYIYHSMKNILLTYDLQVDLGDPGGRLAEVDPAVVPVPVLLPDGVQHQPGRPAVPGAEERPPPEGGLVRPVAGVL